MSREETIVLDGQLLAPARVIPIGWNPPRKLDRLDLILGRIDDPPLCSPPLSIVIRLSP